MHTPCSPTPVGLSQFASGKGISTRSTEGRNRFHDHLTLWRETDISMFEIYMGVLTLALAALPRLSRWLFLAAVFFGCWAVGSHLPVRGWL